MIGLIAIAALAPRESPLLDHSLAAWKAKPEMRIEDAYKWLFHAALGGEHAVLDEAAPRAWMDAEWPTVGRPTPGEREVVPLTPDGRLIRVNMRPYKARGGDPEMLLAVFVQSARSFRGDRKAFVAAWEELGSRLKARGIGKLSYRGWKRLDDEERPKGFAAIHHSSAYERAYHPAYRVVLADLWVGPR